MVADTPEANPEGERDLTVNSSRNAVKGIRNSSTEEEMGVQDSVNCSSS